MRLIRHKRYIYLSTLKPLQSNTGFVMASQLVANETNISTVAGVSGSSPDNDGNRVIGESAISCNNTGDSASGNISNLQGHASTLNQNDKDSFEENSDSDLIQSLKATDVHVVKAEQHDIDNMFSMDDEEFIKLTQKGLNPPTPKMSKIDETEIAVDSNPSKSSGIEQDEINFPGYLGPKNDQISETAKKLLFQGFDNIERELFSNEPKSEETQSGEILVPDDLLSYPMDDLVEEVNPPGMYDNLEAELSDSDDDEELYHTLDRVGSVFQSDDEDQEEYQATLEEAGPLLTAQDLDNHVPVRSDTERSANEDQAQDLTDEVPPEAEAGDPSDDGGDSDDDDSGSKDSNDEDDLSDEDDYQKRGKSSRYALNQTYTVEK